jgi:HTH DNA binding domain
MMWLGERQSQPSAITDYPRDRWLLARHQLDRRLVGRRSNSSLPALADLVVGGQACQQAYCRELKVTPHAAQDLAAELDFREMTGRGRFRARGIL